MFSSASAFNQNVASWSTASVSTMSDVCSLRSHACGQIALGGASRIDWVRACGAAAWAHAAACERWVWVLGCDGLGALLRVELPLCAGGRQWCGIGMHLSPAALAVACCLAPSVGRRLRPLCLAPDGCCTVHSADPASAHAAILLPCCVVLPCCGLGVGVAACRLGNDVLCRVWFACRCSTRHRRSTRTSRAGTY